MFEILRGRYKNMCKEMKENVLLAALAFMGNPVNDMIQYSDYLRMERVY